jgi:polyhydroxybutyrate depolymerase
MSPHRFAVVLAGVATLIAACSAAPSATPGAVSSPTIEPTPVSAGSPGASGNPAGVAFADVCRTTGDFEADAVIEGVPRYLLIHRPAPAATGVAAATGVPLVIALHGNGAKPDAMVYQTGLTAPADQLGFIVAYPAGEDREWGIQLTDPLFRRDGELLASFVDTLVANGCVDPDRVILAGFSLGGISAHTIACTDAARFHLIVAVSARDVSEPCAPTRPVTFVAYNGVLDQVLPYEGGSRFGWKLSSAEGWAAAWAARDSCSGGPATTLANDRVDRLEWSGCRAPVVFYRILQGNHVWPGGTPPIGGLAAEDLDPTETILRLVAGEAP